jgi:hypothetical protein
MTVRETKLLKGPEKELKKFLASKPAWMQRVLQEDFSSFSRDENLEWINNQDRVYELRHEYQRILQQIPATWREYRKKLMRNSLDRLLVPEGRPGRPTKSALAEEAAGLQRAGMNYPQMTAELNKCHGQGTTTSEALRKLLKRHPGKSSR